VSGFDAETPEYQAGRAAYRRGAPVPPCPYADAGRRMDWERGYWDADAADRIRRE